LPSKFLKKKVLPVEPCLQRIENRQLPPNTPGGMGVYPVGTAREHKLSALPPPTCNIPGANTPQVRPDPRDRPPGDRSLAPVWKQGATWRKSWKGASILEPL
jgi:hypothetical protein